MYTVTLPMFIAVCHTAGAPGPPRHCDVAYVYCCVSYGRCARPAASLTLHMFIAVCHTTGAPGPPRHCVALNVTDHEARLDCQPGYDGGEPLDFVVDKQSPHDDLERVSEASPSPLQPPPHPVSDLISQAYRIVSMTFNFVVMRHSPSIVV